VREGGDVTLVSLAATVRTALEAADALQREDGVGAEVIDLRCLVPLDVQTVKRSLEKTGRLVIVEETPRPLGWGAELCSIVVEEMFDYLDAPVTRVTTHAVPLPATPALERLARPSAERVIQAVRGL